MYRGTGDMGRIGVGTFKTTEKMRENIQKVLDSGRISYGYFSREYEKRFSKIHDSEYGIVSNSGTSALHVALQAMKEIHRWGRGDEIIVPATTFVATPNIVLHNQMTPVFVDVETDTFGIDPDLIEQKISERTRAIIPVHLFGQPCKMNEITEIAKAHKLKIIEDSCETMFVKHNGKMVGGMGDIGCFSTYVAHLLVTGVGGMSITKNSEYAAKMRSLVNHGLELSSLNPDNNFSPRPVTGRSFRFESVGHSFRITEFEAALGLAQLDNYKDMLKIRRRNAKHIRAGMKLANRYYENPYHIPEIFEGNEHAWMMLPVLLNEHEQRVDKKEIVSYLNKNNIETRDMLPILGQPFYSWVNPRSYPISAWIREKGFYVGCHQELTIDQCEFVKNKLYEYPGQYTTI